MRAGHRARRIDNSAVEWRGATAFDHTWSDGDDGNDSWYIDALNARYCDACDAGYRDAFIYARHREPWSRDAGHADAGTIVVTERRDRGKSSLKR